ncbi:MAG: VCBS repeat-containing protein [bacterium]|nr:VCBS repeat-containing protein [bacterium]
MFRNKIDRIVSAALVLSVTACGGGGGGGSSSSPKGRVTAPVADVVWSGIQTVRWKSSVSDPDTADIFLSTDSGATYTLIANDVNDSGSFAFDTTGHADGANYRLRVRPRDRDGENGRRITMQGDFTIDNALPVAALVGPVGGEVWGGGRSIQWITTDENPGTVEISISTDAGVTFPTLLSAGVDDVGSYAWDTTGLPDGAQYRVRVTPIDRAGNLGAPVVSAADFILDNTAPTVALTSPLGGEAWTGTQPIAWNVVDAHPDQVEIALSSDSGATFDTILGQFSAGAGSTAWNTGLVSDRTTYRVRIVATDLAGNQSLSDESGTDFSVSNLRTLGPALFADVNQSGTLDAGDEVRVAFDKPIVVNAAPSDFELAVAGDHFGTGATVVLGPRNFEASIVLGTAPRLRMRGLFDDAALVAGSPSAVDIDAAMTPGAITSVAGGLEAVPTVPRDLLPAFESAGLAIGSDATTALATADLDADGDLDVVVGIAGAANRVLLGDGTGQFVDSGALLGTGDTRAVALGDLDGDGDLDLVCGNATAQGDRVYLGDGSGGFTDSLQALGTGETQAVGLGDLDGDGNLDLVCGHGAFQANRVYWGDGTGAFLDSGQLLGTWSTTTVSLRDLDADGDVDLLVGNSGGGAFGHVYLNGGTGTLTGTSTLPQMITRDFGVGDLDGDGDQDVFIGVNGQNQIALNAGDGTFVMTGQFLGNGDHRSIELADVDSDGDLDVLAGKYLNADRLFLNDGSASFTDSGQWLGTHATNAVLLADFDRDGDYDVFEGNDGSADRAWLGSASAGPGSGALVDSGQAHGAGSTRAIAVGDVDRDGDLDWIGGEDGAPNRVLLGGPGGVFTDTGAALGAAATRSLVLCDLDRDGDMDLVEGIASGAADRVWLGDGVGGFVDSGLSLGATDTRALAVGDVDADGDLDLCVGAYGAGNRVWLGDGTGGLVDSGQSLGGSPTTSIALGDVDADGDLDLVCGNELVADRVWLGNGAGVFVDSGQTLGTARTTAVTLADVDRDGDLDLVAGTAGGTDQIWANDGAGTFTTAAAFGAAAVRALAVFDVDTDGDLDIVTALASGAANRIWLNAGDGTFADSGQALGAANSAAFAFGDFDSDGDIDLVTGEDGAAPNSVWWNE